MQWILLIAIAALGVVVLYATSHRHGRGGADAAELAASQDELRRQADAYADSVRRLAETEAASTRAVAERESAALTRAVTVEAETVMRGRRSELDAEKARLEQLGQDLDRRRGELERSRTELDTVRAHAETARAQLDSQRGELDAVRSELAGEVAAVDRRSEEQERIRLEQDERADELDDQQEQLRHRAGEHDDELERIAGLSPDDARLEIMRAVEVKARREAAVLARSIEAETRAEATVKARAIIVEAVQRCASDQTTETVVSVMHLPSDEMKGRIIGREGRNIRSFEAVTGVNVIIDDTPEAVLLSCFDPTRREIGRLTLQRLVADGRIHPHRIEEAYEQSRAEVDALCLRAAVDALTEVGIHDLDERLLPYLGRLKYRTSYGQNVLGHLVESAHIAGVMAAEIGVAPATVIRGAFLHDIGKALTHEVQGSHAIIGADLLRRHGESEDVAHAVEAHHNEVTPHSIEAVLTQAADACSAARPGARRETLESYVNRLQRIEEISSSKHGVERVFAMQAGREVRVMVQPDAVDDLEAQVMAREIAKQIEDELTYPGQIRVTVVRESRASEVAH